MDPPPISTFTIIHPSTCSLVTGLGRQLCRQGTRALIIYQNRQQTGKVVIGSSESELYPVPGVCTFDSQTNRCTTLVPPFGPAGSPLLGSGSSLGFRFVWRRQLPTGLLKEKGPDELVQVAVQNAIHIANLVFGPVILDHAVGRQDVGADLAPEGDVLLLAADLVEFRLLLLQLQVVEPRSQHLHRRGPVLVLRPFVLTRHHDARRQVRQPDR